MWNIIKLILGYIWDFIKIALLTPPILITIAWYIFVWLIYDEELISKIMGLFLYPLTFLPFSDYKWATSFHLDWSDFVSIFILYSLIFTIIIVSIKYILKLIFKNDNSIFKNKKVKKYVILTLCNIQFIFWILFLIISDVKIRGTVSDMEFIIVFSIMMFVNTLWLYIYLSIVPQIKIESVEVGENIYKV
jgi:hypothetical protein